MSRASGCAEAAGSGQAAGRGPPQRAEPTVPAPGAAAAACADGAAATGASSQPAPGSAAGRADAAAGLEAPAGSAASASAAAAGEGAAGGAVPGPFGAALRPDSLEAAAVELAGILGNAAWWSLQGYTEFPSALRRRRLRDMLRRANADPADASLCALPCCARSPCAQCKGLGQGRAL